MKQENLTFNIDQRNRMDVIIPTEPKYEEDEIEIWLVGDKGKNCLFKDSWRYSFLYEAAHVVNAFRDLRQKNHYRPNELEYRYFKHLTAGEEDAALWDYLLFSHKKSEVFLAESGNGCAVLVVSEMNPYEDVPSYRQAARYTIESKLFLSWYDNLVAKLEKVFTV